MDGNPSTLSILSDKYIFVNPNEDQFVRIKNCLDIELENGQGECFLELGIGDGQCPGLTPQEMNQSVCTAERLADCLASHLIHLRDRWITAGPQSSTTTTVQTTSSVNTTTTPKLSTTNNNTQSSSPRRNNSGGHSSTTRKDSIHVDNESESAKNTDDSNNKNKELSKRNASEINMTTTTTTSTTTTPVMSSNSSLVKEYLLRRKTASDDFVDVRVAVVGNVDAGKSTLLGVLTHGELDNGRGLARLRLLRHKHEAESGRTSSVAHDILGFNSVGQVVNKPMHGHLNWSEICEASAKVITFIDLAGHERYLKTTIFGMTGHAPDYVMFMVGANAGVIGMAKEHLGLALALCVPVFVVVTKIDMCPSNVLQETMNLLVRILKSPGCRKIPVLISSTDDVICCATNFTSERMCPIFSVSNVNGTNLDLLKLFLNLLPSRSEPRLNELAHFQIDEIFSVQGVGTIISGTCLSGVIKLNDILLLGPDLSGQFNLISIKSIQRKRLSVNYVRGGQTASFALKKLRRNQVRTVKELVPYTASIQQNPRTRLYKKYVSSPIIRIRNMTGTVKELVPYTASIQQNPRTRLYKKYVTSSSNKSNQPINNINNTNTGLDENKTSLPKSTTEYASTTTTSTTSQSADTTTELLNTPVSELLSTTTNNNNSSSSHNTSTSSRQRRQHHHHHHRTRTVKELVPYTASIQQNPRTRLYKKYVTSSSNKSNQPINIINNTNTGLDENKTSLPKSTTEYASTTTTSTTSQSADTTTELLLNTPVSELLSTTNSNNSSNTSSHNTSSSSRQRRQHHHHHRTRKNIAE
ncbi:unnamed protein product [Schistosoma turkestanicum]|nr:unnamed protein product [Schistosoma turkestanicum]